MRLRHPFTLQEHLAVVMLAERMRQQVDGVLADLVLAAVQEDTAEAWSKVHDRLQVLGRFDDADRYAEAIRRLMP